MNLFYRFDVNPLGISSSFSFLAAPRNAGHKFRIFRNITQEKLMISKFLGFDLKTVKVFWIPGSKYLKRDPKANARFCLIELLYSKIKRVLEVE